jgi:hypothetical protein
MALKKVEISHLLRQQLAKHNILPISVMRELAPVRLDPERTDFSPEPTES